MLGAVGRSETRILVVEDEAIVARDLEQRLQELGYVVTGTATSGAEALALAESTRPTLVFMDITIQGPIDGVETAKRMSRRMDVPVVFLTAHMDTGTMVRAKGARPYGYLIKPLEDRELLATIEMALSRHERDLPARLIEQAIASAGIGVALVSAVGPNHPITMSNAAFERMLGFEPNAVIGRSPWFLDSGEPGPTQEGRLRRAIDEGIECRFSSLLRPEGGKIVPVDLALSPVRNPHGAITHFLLCLGVASQGPVN